MSMNTGIQNLIDWLNARNLRVRTVVPGKAEAAPTASAREQTVDFASGVADLEAGEEAPPGVAPDAPVLSMSGGGFFCLLPVSQGDEMLGLCSDRSLAEWIPSRQVGQADKINGKRSKVLSDILLTQFSITAPPGAPETWDHLVIGGPLGVGVEIFANGRMLLTKSGGTVATIDMSVPGSVTIEVQPGQSVNIGGPAAVTLPKWDQLEAALDAFIAALVAAGSGPTYAGAGAAQGVWQGAKTTVGCSKAKGE